MNIIARPNDGATPLSCPSWCTGGEAGHAPNAPIRCHEGELAPLPALADGGSAHVLAEVSVVRHDEEGRVGEAVVTLEGLELSPTVARRLADSLRVLADLAEAA